MTRSVVKIDIDTLSVLVESADKWADELAQYVIPEAAPQDAEGYQDALDQLTKAVDAARALYPRHSTIIVTTDTELGEKYPKLKDINDERVLALEAIGNCHLVVEGDLEQFARDVWQAVFDAEPDSETSWYTCVDCDSGDMVEDAAQWHASREGHLIEKLDQTRP